MSLSDHNLGRAATRRLSLCSTFTRHIASLVAPFWAIAPLTLFAAAPAATISAALQEEGVLVHAVETECQSAKTQIRVLLPDNFDKTRKYRAVFILPVEGGRETRYGDGLLEFKKLELHNKHELVCVAPTFAKLPWYADHPSDKQLQQETYFVQVVVPYIERTYNIPAQSDHRLLVGFSKSGWGAWTLLLRHPDLFGKAAAWDAPLIMGWPSQFGSLPIFATPENFENYRVTKLIADAGPRLGSKTRLGLVGYGNFLAHHRAVHVQLDELKIPHLYLDGPPKQHTWESGWLTDAVEFVVSK